MGWAQSVTNLTLKVGGSTVGGTSGANPTILGATFGGGRSDWFASLSPGSASFTLLGDLTGSIDPGDTLELERGTDDLWTGKVDTVTLVQAPGQPDQTTVTGADFVAQLGEAKLKSQNVSQDLYHEQLSDVLGFADITATVSLAPSKADDGQLGAWSSYTGTVLDWISTAERYANCVTAVSGGGSILVCPRGALPDYGERVLNVAGGGIGITFASSLWRMGEASGDILDEGPNARDGADAGTPTYNAIGPWGASGPTAILFEKDDAADEFVIGDFYDLSGTSAWTIAGWVRWSGDSSSRSTIMSKIAAGPNGWLLQVGTGGEVRYQAYVGGSTICSILTAAGTIPANTWKHVAVRLLSGSVAIFVDGQVVGGPTALGGSIPNTAASLRFGSNAGASEWMDGRLCMWAIWNSDALLQAQIRTLIYLDYVTLPKPVTFTTTRSITNVINHWLIGGIETKKTTSIGTYGRRTWDVDDTKELSGDVYTSELKDVMADPRPVVTATFSVTDTSSPLITIAPLALALYDGTLYQVLQVQHDLDPSEWRVTLILDRTQNDLNGAASALPV